MYTARDAVCCETLRCSAKDVVVLDLDGTDTVAKVQGHAMANDICISCVVPWTKQRGNIFSTTGQAIWTLTSDIKNVCVYRPEGRVAFVVPPRSLPSI